jgi:hypothetical protein
VLVPWAIAVQVEFGLNFALVIKHVGNAQLCDRNPPLWRVSKTFQKSMGYVFISRKPHKITILWGFKNYAITVFKPKRGLRNAPFIRIFNQWVCVLAQILWVRTFAHPPKIETIRIPTTVATAKMQYHTPNDRTSAQ